MNIAKHKTFGQFFADFLSNVLLVIFIKTRSSNLRTDGESVLKRTAIANVVFSTQTGTRLNRGHYIQGNHLL